MNRRSYLSVLGMSSITAVAGCVGIFQSGGKYHDVTEKQLMPGLGVFPNGWKRSDAGNYRLTAFTNRDESIVVLFQGKVEKTVRKAKKWVKSQRQSYPNPRDVDIGDGGFSGIRDNSAAFTVFYDSNAVGEAVVSKQLPDQSIPDRSLSKKYAKKMYDYWQTL